jgi:hypothetical protein
MHFISFYTSDYSKSALSLLNSVSTAYPQDYCKLYKPSDLPASLKHYCEANPRGYGFWRWKSYIISNHLRQMDLGDTLWYIDAGAFIIRNSLPSFPGNLYLQSSFFHDVRMWCSSVLEYLPSSEDFFRSAIMVDASVIGFKCNKETLQLVEEWESLCCNHKLISGFSSKSQIIFYFIC